jgi:hypothetical protein
MTKPTPQPGDPGIIYIDELVGIVNRESDTIRKWCYKGLLPKRLMPKQGFRNRRYWTYEQVHGKNGILDWMKKNNMRPGNLVASPSKEDQHVANLRKPKHLTGHQIYSAKRSVEKGQSARTIARRIHNRAVKRGTNPWYSSIENTEAALRRYFKSQGWYFPSPPRKKRAAPDPLLMDIRTRLNRARRAA